MLGKSLASSPLLTGIHAPKQPRVTILEAQATRPSLRMPIVNSLSLSTAISLSRKKLDTRSKKWALQAASEAETTASLSTEEDEKPCREALCSFGFSKEEAEKMLGKAFGWVHSPYWGEERKRVVPRLETVNEILNYMRSLNLSDEDLYKVLKKFPEVLGCDLEAELRNNVGILESKWGIKGKPLRNLLLRNPKALGYNVDCGGDCIAQCTRCWARF